MYPAAEREGDKAEANCLDIMLFALFFFVTSHAAKGMVAEGIVCGVSTGALYAGGKDWDP
jgi:hypothetical protein